MLDKSKDSTQTPPLRWVFQAGDDVKELGLVPGAFAPDPVEVAVTPLGPKMLDTLSIDSCACANVCSWLGHIPGHPVTISQSGWMNDLKKWVDFYTVVTRFPYMYLVHFAWMLGLQLFAN